MMPFGHDSYLYLPLRVTRILRADVALDTLGLHCLSKFAARRIVMNSPVGFSCRRLIPNNNLANRRLEQNFTCLLSR